MPLPTTGGIFLDGVQFTTDPSIYEPANWEKRYSVTPAIGGKRTVQDFGVFMRDNTLRLGSGGVNVLNEATVVALHTRFRTRGVMYTFTDFVSNSFGVFIKTFVPIPVKKGRDQQGNVSTVYVYTMELQVLQITQLFGVAYTGS
jgi:hypothetical protein